jgi:hypothetical protein
MFGRPALSGAGRRTDGAGAFFLISLSVQLPEIAVIEKPADHVRRDQLCADRIKLVPGRKLKLSIGTGQGSLETSMENGCNGFYKPLMPKVSTGISAAFSG